MSRSRAVLLCLSALWACRNEPAPAPQSAPQKAPASEARQQDSYRQPERLVAALGLRQGDAVAEVGAGGGYLSLRLARAVGPGGRVVSTDIDGQALAALRRRAAAAGLSRIETRLVIPSEPGLERAAYDLILLAQVDHLLPDRAAYLRALLPALKPGGRIAISNSARYRSALEACAQGLPVSIVIEPVALPNQFLLSLHPRKSP